SILELALRAGEENAVARAANGDEAIARTVDREEHVLRRRRNDNERHRSLSMQHRSARADDPDVVAGAPRLEEPKDLAHRRARAEARQIDRQVLGLELSSVV